MNFTTGRNNVNQDELGQPANKSWLRDAKQALFPKNCWREENCWPLSHPKPGPCFCNRKAWMTSQTILLTFAMRVFSNAHPKAEELTLLEAVYWKQRRMEESLRWDSNTSTCNAAIRIYFQSIAISFTNSTARLINGAITTASMYVSWLATRFLHWWVSSGGSSKLKLRSVTQTGTWAMWGIETRPTAELRAGCMTNLWKTMENIQ